MINLKVYANKIIVPIRKSFFLINHLQESRSICLKNYVIEGTKRGRDSNVATRFRRVFSNFDNTRLSCRNLCKTIPNRSERNSSATWRQPSRTIRMFQ